MNLQLNGSPVEIPAVSPNTTLLDWLRGTGRTGTKEGCAEGDCGACSVAVSLPGADGQPCWRTVNSCLIPLAALAGRSVRTVEGLSSGGKPHAVQDAMVRHHGSQCGYCTPGVVMSLFEGCHRKDLKHEADLDEQLAGNLCRCTGYRAIREAALEAWQKPCEDGLPAPASQAAASESVSLSGVFLRPANLAELFAARARFPDARLVAGATELGLEITKRHRRFDALISLEHVAELNELRETREAWHIGAGVSLTNLLERLGGEFPSLKQMFWWFGSRQIRSRATLGGNLVTASPIGDSAPVLLTFGTGLVLASPSGERTVPLAEFFVSYRKTALRPDEVLKTIVLPRNDGCQRAFFKLSKRREMDISTVSGAFAVKLENNRVAAVRLAYGGVAATPVRAVKTEAFLLGKPWDTETFATAETLLNQEFQPISDVRGTAAYRSALVAALFRKFAHGDDPLPSSEPLGRAAPPTDSPPHESGHRHVNGEARYVDDTAGSALETWPVLAPHARARILSRDGTAARAMPGVRAVFFAADIPGQNDTAPLPGQHDEPLLAEDEILFHSQIVALVVADTQEQARLAADKVAVAYEPLPAILSAHEALTAKRFHTVKMNGTVFNSITRGDCAEALQSAPRKLSGEFSFGGQDHFYLESQAAWAEPSEDGSLFVNSSTQHPSEVQQAVAHALNWPFHRVTVQCPRMGGGFGGKETQAAAPAVLAALAAVRTGRRVRVRFNRDQDMALTGKRHPFLSKFEVGFSPDGKLLALRAELYADGGWSLDLSRAIADRAILHLDNSYFLPAVEVKSAILKTDIASNTAFRGFGGPQGMLIIEEIMDRIARATGLAPEVVRGRNLYHGTGPTNTTHYGQEIADNRIERVWRELLEQSDFGNRRSGIAAWNAAHRRRPRGLAITPVKFGISFTLTHLNQAGALVLIYQDGSVQVNHGGTEMGQGIHTNIAQIAARELDVSPELIRVMPTRTDKVPNTSPTAASSGTDLNGAAVANACQQLSERLAPFRTPERTFPQAVMAAYVARVSLSASGYYRTPGISMDWSKGQGTPFHYYAVGASVSEVEVDADTGQFSLLRTDILHDVGTPINPAVCRGQLEGGFVQGAGWLTCEELVWDAKGELRTHSPDTYKIPAVGDRPRDFRVAFLTQAEQPGNIHGSKAVGEPPLMLAISVREAIRDAIASLPGQAEIPLASPATPEAIWRATQARKCSP